MHNSRWLLGLILLGLSSTVALADGIDPKIVLGPTGSQNTFTQSQCHAGTDSQVSGCQFITTGPDNAVTIDIINNLESFIVQDTVTLRTAFSGPLSCAAAETAPGWVGTTSTDGQSCIFTGGFISPGFTYGLTFSLFTAGTYLFDLSEVTSPTAPTVPEPGTIILLGIGLAAVAAGRKKLKGSSTSSSGVC